MSTTEKIFALFIEPGKGEYLDGDMDAANTSPYGILTWRREGQLLPAASRIIFTFDAEDAMTDHSVAFVEQLMSFNGGCMTREKAMAISVQFHQAVREAIAQHGDNWGYFHSERHSRLVQYNQAEESRTDLADWELEILDGIDNES